MKTKALELREVTDLDTLLSWRREVLTCVFSQAPTQELMDANRRYYSGNVPGRHRAVEALLDGDKAGCGAICLSQELPSPDNPDGRCAYLMNIYVRPDFRHQGVGSAIVDHLVSLALTLGCDKIYLETTSMARSMYAAAGFVPYPDMMKIPYQPV